MKKLFSKTPSYLLLLGVIIFAWFIYKTFISCPTCLAAEKEPKNVLGVPLKIDKKSLEVQTPAPDFTLKNLEGKEVSLSDFTGKNVLLIFWATTCGWCEKERPSLMKIAEEQKDKIEVLAIVWEPEEIVKAYAEEKKINFTILFDTNGEAQVKYLAFGTPNHFFIDKESKIVFKKPGYIPYENLLMLIQSLEE